MFMLINSINMYLASFFDNEEGAETLEWVVIATIIIILGIAAYTTGGISIVISTMFSKVISAV